MRHPEKVDVCLLRFSLTSDRRPHYDETPFVTVPPELGNKTIHPYSDFLLHSVNTGDGIVQNGGQSTRNKIRTAPLWGLRTRNRFMHDGETLTLNDAILRHGGEAYYVISNYRHLSSTQRNQILTFLRSL